ncbi:MAG TPA: PaaI family thioesterase [Stellaceae bacterium]|nr:PaaI family thioesterase [Stellaceae bacterium]
MPAFRPKDENFEPRVRDSFARQALMRLIGARLARVEPGLAEIELSFRADLTQQHGYLHAGITSAIADSAGGYAAFTLFPAESSILTVEFKINLVAPAAGERFLAVGRVLRPGRTLTVCGLEVFALLGSERTTIALGQQTLICLEGQPDR